MNSEMREGARGGGGRTDGAAEAAGHTDRGAGGRRSPGGPRDASAASPGPARPHLRNLCTSFFYFLLKKKSAFETREEWRGQRLPPPAGHVPGQRPWSSRTSELGTIAWNCSTPPLHGLAAFNPSSPSPRSFNSSTLSPLNF